MSAKCDPFHVVNEKLSRLLLWKKVRDVNEFISCRVRLN